MAEKKLNVFRVLNRINAKDKHFYNQLSDVEKKGFAPVVVMRWMTGSSSQTQLIYVNELLNPLVFQLQKHPELLYDIMTVCAVEPPTRYKWPKTRGKSSSSMKTVLSVIQEYYEFNEKKAEEALVLFTDGEIMEVAHALGRQSTDLAKIKKELKNR